MGIVEKWAVRWNKRTMWKEKRKGYGEMNESRGRKSGRKVKKRLSKRKKSVRIEVSTGLSLL